ncbi:cell adhesion molecule Dscam1-like [Oratosquilla oratoria]|uniref:cell adhesion molecule Dscam1-like n=1 Tax=Oratosquilla oratoria TaxID=337810 RepID=UPI003F76D158
MTSVPRVALTSLGSSYSISTVTRTLLPQQRKARFQYPVAGHRPAERPRGIETSLRNRTSAFTERRGCLKVQTLRKQQVRNFRRELPPRSTNRELSCAAVLRSMMFFGSKGSVGDRSRPMAMNVHVWVVGDYRCFGICSEIRFLDFGSQWWSFTEFADSSSGVEVAAAAKGSLGVCSQQVVSLASSTGPILTVEPPHQVVFSNSSGSVLDCVAAGSPLPSIYWRVGEGSSAPVNDVPGLRMVLSNGSLAFLPFPADRYRPDVHQATYRCVAVSSVGTVLARLTHVHAVVLQHWEVAVYDEYSTAGSDVTLRCNVPAHVRSYVTVTSWVRDETHNIYPNTNDGSGVYITGSGELTIGRVGPDIAGARWRCRALHTLTGQTILSNTARIIVADLKEVSAPRILESPNGAEPPAARPGDAVALPCAAQGNPPSEYRFASQIREGQKEIIEKYGNKLSIVIRDVSSSM